jgi:hypothetical protein
MIVFKQVCLWVTYTKKTLSFWKIPLVLSDSKETDKSLAVLPEFLDFYLLIAHSLFSLMLPFSNQGLSQ